MTIHQEHETHEMLERAALGEQGDPCLHCGAPLAHDQRYCLNCGKRRAAADLFRAHVAKPAPQPPPATARWQPTPVQAGAAVALLALAVAIGVLIGAAGGDSPTRVAAPPPQIITVAGVGAATPAEQFTGDWPDGKDGYTVQLRTLPKDGTQVSAVQSAKSEAQAKGATDVGALDSDEFSSLEGGSYVIYAGVFDAKKQAKKELRDLKADFAGAKVIKVSAGGGLASEGDAGALSGKKKSATVGKKQLEGLENLSPDEYQKKAKKLPDETKLPGKAPPKDNKKPGGGTKGEEIG